MVKCRRVRRAVSARTTAALVLLVLPTAVAFLHPSISSVLPPATVLCDDGAKFCWLEDGGASSRGGGGTKTSSSVVGGRIGRDGGGVASLRAEILPEGGVSPCIIKVVGVGGGGGNAVVRMNQQTIPGVEFWCLNTDAQAINSIPEAIKTLQIGNDVTRGLGAGGVPDIGKRAAEESRADIAEVVAGADMVFVTAGMGGGTGSGAAPIVADVAKEMGALTVGVVTKPFGFEGRRRLSQASAAINELRGAVDTLIVVANDRLLEVAGSGIPLERAFSVADDILRQGVVGISEIIVRPGIINVDFADVRSVMSNAGTALMGIGSGEGKTKAEDAANAAISSPLLDSPIDKAKGIVFNIIGGNDMSLQEINAAAEVIYGEVDPTANIIFGALVDERMEGRMSITVLATGFQTKEEMAAVQGGVGVASQGQAAAAPPGAMRPSTNPYAGRGGGGYGQQQQQQQQQQAPANQLPPQAPRRLPPPGYQPPPPKQGGRAPPPTTPPLPGGANNPSDIPDFLTRLKRSQR
ncbi:unnamed protein product [Ectocarpus sp. CCAP 1310/34]|nr:unnamed protein product [Ectocarpus sp. CCAP 1310/34]